MTFPDGIVVLTGRNGQGKTNLLEAVHYISLLRSFRTRRQSDMCQWDASSFFIEAHLCGSADPLSGERLSVVNGDVRRLAVDGVEVCRASEFINHVLCVAFVPEDIGLIKGPPAERRRFLDICLCQTNGSYLAHLNRYQRALKSRNAMLRNAARFDTASRHAYERELVFHGVAVTLARRQFVEQFATALRNIGELVFPCALRVDALYSSQLLRHAGEAADAAALSDQFMEQLHHDAAAQCEYPATRVGPHRDDIRFKLNGRSADVFASEGQCRLYALALRLAFVQLRTGDAPETDLVLLVDDVFGELDSERRREFFCQLERGRQIFLACTEIPEELADRTAAMYTVNAGSVAGPVTI